MQETVLTQLEALHILKILYKEITLYQKKYIYIGTLINFLDYYLRELNTDDKSWKKQFRSNWTNLEIIHALSLENEYEKSTKKDEEEIHIHLEEMKKLITEKLSEIEDEIDFLYF